MAPIIEVRNIGKKYNISHMRGGYVALRDVIATTLKNPFGFLRHKAQSMVGLKKKEAFWALRNISFSVERGEVIGVVGSNGAGKSTLLKILSQITPPTEGEIILRGRVGSLLEVGTGFHPELTGRENIFLNGAILGMKRKEIAKKFDEIVAFAGIEKFLDTPVKHYSSGMYVRLAFSVAAHMEPDILLVDEVLAVGDAEFQKKCLGKMDEITKKEGRTILFVSHNLGAIEQLCSKTLLLKNGNVEMFDETSKVMEAYLKRSKELVTTNIRERSDRKGDGRLIFTGCHLELEDNHPTPYAVSGKDMKVVFEYECQKDVELKDIVIGASVMSQDGSSVFICHSEMTKTNFGIVSGKGRFECIVPHLPLVPGTYFLTARIASQHIELDSLKNILDFEVLSGDFFGNGTSIKHSLVYVDQAWNIKKS